MTNRRSELAEMTALYLIPIVAVVIAATSGSLVAHAIPNQQHQFWTLIISYVLWGIGSPLSWIILTLYFLRMTLHEPLKREVIVSLLLPIGPLSLSGFSSVITKHHLSKESALNFRGRIITLSKVADRLFTATHALPRVTHISAGEALYTVSFIVGLILWGFSIVWFVVAGMMVATAGGFPFNMGWWGFIFPVGSFIVFLSLLPCVTKLCADGLRNLLT
jgi:tellurite resistance protein TehA-like permease